MLGIIIPARNEEENIEKVLSNLFSLNLQKTSIFVIDNNSTDQTSEIAKNLGVNVIKCEEIGYQSALSKGFAELIKYNYKKFLIIDGDNEIGIESIRKFIQAMDSFEMIVGYRSKIKRFGERIVNKYFDKKFGIKDLMCGLKYGHIDFYNENNNLEFGIDFFKYEKISRNKIHNIPIDINLREETRLGNYYIVTIKLVTNLIKYIFKKNR